MRVQPGRDCESIRHAGNRDDLNPGRDYAFWSAEELQALLLRNLQFGQCDGRIRSACEKSILNPHIDGLGSARPSGNLGQHTLISAVDPHVGQDAEYVAQSNDRGPSQVTYKGVNATRLTHQGHTRR